MFPYLRKNSDYLEDCKNPEESAKTLAELVNHSNWKASSNAGKGEIDSWKLSTFGKLKDILKDCDPNLCIGIEYFTEREDAGRVDMMIGGYGRDGKAKILVIELKQWSAVKASEGNPKLCTPCNIKGRKLIPIYDKLIEKPALTLQKYIESVTKHNTAKIDLIPVIYAHNMEPKDDSIDLSLGGNVRVYYKGRKQDLINFIKDTLIPGRSSEENRNVFQKLRNGYESVHSKDFAKLFVEEPVVKGETKSYKRLVSYLRPDQKYVLDEIEEHMRSGEHHIDVIYGGPGSGKTLVALLAIRKLQIDNYERENNSENTQTCAVAYEGSAPFNRLQYDMEETGAQGFSINYVSKLGELDYEPYHLIFDEFHRLSLKNKQVFMDAFNEIQGTVILLIDERQMLTEEDVGADILKEIMDNEEVKPYHLRSQFRCGCDDGYVSWLEYKLCMGTKSPVKLSELDFKPEIIKDKKNLEKELNRRNPPLLLVNNRATLKTINEKYKFKKEIQANDKKHGLIVEDDGLAGGWYDVHGIEFDNVIVLIGNDLTLDSLNKDNMEITKNRYRMLLTRGMKCCKIFCYDERLADYLADDTRP